MAKRALKSAALPDPAPLAVDPAARRVYEASGGLSHDILGNEVLVGLNREETVWYLAHLPNRLDVRPYGPRTQDELRWRELHVRYRDARLRFYPGPRRFYSVVAAALGVDPKLAAPAA